jgi:hypothetical protein
VRELPLASAVGSPSVEEQKLSTPFPPQGGFWEFVLTLRSNQSSARLVTLKVIVNRLNARIPPAYGISRGFHCQSPVRYGKIQV